MVNTNQLIVANYLYDPFGNILSISGALADANLYRFSSKELHLNSGLVYYLYRYYEPTLQRWANMDPIEEFGFNLLRKDIGLNSIQYATRKKQTAIKTNKLTNTANSYQFAMNVSVSRSTG